MNEGQSFLILSLLCCRLLVERLKNVPAVIDRTKFEHDFERHLQLGAHMRRKIPGQDQHDESKISPYFYDEHICKI